MAKGPSLGDINALCAVHSGRAASIAIAMRSTDGVDLLRCVFCHDLQPEAGAALGHGRELDEVGDDAERR